MIVDRNRWENLKNLIIEVPLVGLTMYLHNIPIQIDFILMEIVGRSAELKNLGIPGNKF